MGKDDVLARLSSFLDTESPHLAEFLYREWGDMQHAITYHELRDAIIQGELSISYLTDWQQRYSRFVNDAYAPIIRRAIEQATADLRIEHGVEFRDPMRDNVNDWIMVRGGQLIRQISDDQYFAINGLVRQAAMTETMTVDQLARKIRPCVGLTQRQSQTVSRYYDSLIEQGYSHKKAYAMELNYAGKVHRQRANLIAQTELAYGYNGGWHMTVQQSVGDGVLPHDTRKVWATAFDERVCPACGKMEGESVLFNEPFSNGDMYPPAHPRCRCSYTVDFSHVLQAPPPGEQPFDTPPEEEEPPDGGQPPQGQPPQGQPSQPAQPLPDTLGGTTQGYTQAQQDARMQLVQRAEQPVRDFWNANAGQLQPVKEDVGKGKGHFSSADERVHFRIADDVKGRSDQNPYSLGFHEYGHNMDYLHRNAQGQYLSEHYIDPATGKTLEQMVMQESRKMVQNYYDRNQKNLIYSMLMGEADPDAAAEKALREWAKAQGIRRGSSTWKAMLDELRDYGGGAMAATEFFADNPDVTRHTIFGFDGMLGHPKKSNLLGLFCRDVQKTFSLRERTDISDMFEHFSVTHGGPDYPFGIGHGKKYWTSSGDRTGKETFAEMTSASISQKESLAVIKQMYPQSYQIYINMLRSVLP